MTKISKKHSDVKSPLFELVETVPPETEKGTLVQVVGSGKYYEFDGENWNEIEPKEALKKWEKRMSRCVRNEGEK